MKKIEAIVETGKLADIREALRDVGIRSMRVTGAAEIAAAAGNAAMKSHEEDELHAHSKARISVVVPDDMTDKVLLTLLANVKRGGTDDGEPFLSSIEHVVRLEAAGLLDGII